MKAIKVIGLAALTTLMAVAFVGAPSAMAEKTTLCSGDGSGCGLTHVHETSVGKAKLLTSFGTTECDALFLGDVKGAWSAAPLVLEGSFTYSSCALGSTSCTATEESGPSELKVLREGHEKTKVTGEGLVHLVCGLSIDCSYNGVGLVGTGKGPLLSTQTNGEVSLSEQATTKETGGFLCPKSSKLDITTTPLSATYLSESGGGGSCEAPSVVTTAASSVTSGSAYLNGEVNPHGCETTYFFEIKKSGENWEKNFTNWAGSVNFSVPVSEWEPFLQPNTTYEYRLNATNGAGSKQGSAVKFTTLEEPPPGKAPSVTTEAASGITSSGATLNGSVNPNGLSTTYKFDYGTTKGSLTESTKPVNIGSGTISQKVKAEVSLEPGTLYYFRISATNSVGTSTGGELSFTTSTALWKIQKTLNPEGASDTNLYDVSCEPSTNACTAVGKSTSSGVDSPLAQRWNGTSWSEQTAAKKSGSTHNRLLGVDCPSETRCIAVGNYQNSEGGPATLGELWNESKWSVQTTPVPSEATSSELVAVGCNSTASCRAGGSAVIKSVKTAIMEKWASPTWSSESIPIPEGATSSQLDGIDCIWSNFCAAVGRYTTSGGSIKNLAMFWNGTEWKLQTLTDPKGAAQSTLLDVACTPTPNRCTAVGGWKNSAYEQFTLAYRFDGSTWTLQSTPNPSGSIASVFQEVSCPTETSCTAAGSWVSSSGGSNQTLAEEWNGSSWSIQGTPNPAGATFSAFFGASCRGTACINVGWSTNASGVDTTLAEIRE